MQLKEQPKQVETAKQEQRSWWQQLLARGRRLVSGERRLLGGSAVLLFSNLGGSALGFLVSISVARLLGSASFGQYAFITAVIFTADGALEAGLDSLLTRDVAADPSRSRPYLRLITRIKLLLAALIALGFLLYAQFANLDPQLRDLFRLAALPALPIMLNSSFINLFRAWQQMSIILALSLGTLTLQLLLYLSAILLGGGVGHLLVLFFVAQGCMTVAAYFIYRRLAPAEGAEPLRTGVLLRRTLPFAISGGLQVLGGSVDLFMINAFFSPLEVGYYAIAIRFYNGLRQPPNALFGALFPNLSERAAQAGAQLNRTFRLGLRLLALYILVAASFFALIATPLIYYTYGDSYAASAHILRALVWANLPLLLNAACLFYLYARNDEHFATLIIAANLGLRVLLIAILTASRGPLGAAVGLGLAEAVTLLLYSFRVKAISQQVREGS